MTPNLDKILDRFQRSTEVDTVAALSLWLRHHDGCPETPCTCSLDAVITELVGEDRTDLNAAIQEMLTFGGHGGHA